MESTEGVDKKFSEGRSRSSVIIRVLHYLYGRWFDAFLFVLNKDCSIARSPTLLIEAPTETIESILTKASNIVRIGEYERIYAYVHCFGLTPYEIVERV